MSLVNALEGRKKNQIKNQEWYSYIENEICNKKNSYEINDRCSEGKSFPSKAQKIAAKHIGCFGVGGCIVEPDRPIDYPREDIEQCFLGTTIENPD